MSKKYISPASRSLSTLEKTLNIGRMKARQMILLAMVASHASYAMAQQAGIDQFMDNQAINSNNNAPAPAPDGRQQPVNDFRLFPVAGKKVSFSEIAKKGGDNFLQFVEYLFAIVIPSAIIFAVILYIFHLLAKIVPKFVVDFLKKVDSPIEKQIGTYYLIKITLYVGGLYVGLRAIGFDLISLSLMFGVVAIVVPAAFTDIILNSVSGILLHYSGKIKLGEIYEINGVKGRIEQMAHFDVIIRLLENPAVTATKSNHECFTATVFHVDKKIETTLKIQSELESNKIE